MSGVSITGPSDQSGPLNHGGEPHEVIEPAAARQSAPLPPVEPATGTSIPAPPASEDPARAGPSVARGEWLDEPGHWLTTGNHQIPRPRVSQQALQRPKRFHRVPQWVSAAVLAAVLVGAVITGILMIHAAGTVIPQHSAHPTATPTHKATPAHK
jgi:hypothetical protein